MSDFTEHCGDKGPFNTEAGIACEDWLYSFMKNFKFCVRKPAATLIARAAGFNRVQVGMYYQILREVRQK